MQCTKNALEMLYIMCYNIHNINNPDHKCKNFMPLSTNNLNYFDVNNINYDSHDFSFFPFFSMFESHTIFKIWWHGALLFFRGE